TFAGAAHSAPFGGAGICASGESGAGTRIVNAIHRPSGDQLSPRGDWVRCVIAAESALAIQRTKIWDLPSSAATQASRLPSGDQAAPPSFAGPVVSGRLSRPSLPIIQRFARLRSFMTSNQQRS